MTEAQKIEEHALTTSIPTSSNSEKSKDLACSSPKNSKVFTTHPKRGYRRNHKRKPIHEDSSALSMLLSNDFDGQFKDLFGGEIKHLSFDCPENLRTAFNEECWSNGEDSCRILRRMMADYTISSHSSRHALGNTLSNVLKPQFFIGSMTSNQYVQNRPRRLMRTAPVHDIAPLNVSEQKGEVIVKRRCEFNGCDSDAVGMALLRSKNQEYVLCAVHLKEVSLNRLNWRVS